MGWKKIEDSKVRHNWKCPNRDHSCDVECSVDPSFYSLSGTPVCEHCGDDMEYVSTEVFVKE
jgi:transcription elongation factor Elf1